MKKFAEKGYGLLHLIVVVVVVIVVVWVVLAII
jgi:hypothetical protein